MGILKFDSGGYYAESCYESDVSETVFLNIVWGLGMVRVRAVTMFDCVRNWCIAE
jgi:hypothetical protein